MVESLPANVGDTGLSPGLGRSHMPRSSWAREPQLLSLCVWSLCSAAREAAMVRGLRTMMRSGSRLPRLEEALAQMSNTITEMKNTLQGINSRITEAEGRITDQEDRMVEFTAKEHNKEKKNEKN